MPTFKRSSSLLRPELWSQWLAPFKGAPASGLEIGSWEGASALWFIENILTHSEASLTCIDTFQGNSVHQGNYDCSYLESSFRANLAEPLQSGKARVYVGKSQEQLRSCWACGARFAFAYIDGAHEAPAVLEDSVLVWRMLQPRGVLFWDDYEWRSPSSTEIDAPKIAIDAFLHCFARELRVLHVGFQVAVQKSEA